MFRGGYWAKTLRIDLSKQRATVEEIDPQVLRCLLGGRGVAAWYYYREIGPEIDPLAADNKLIFVTGPLTGLPLPATGKFQCATKSPQTGIYLCSNSGGNFGPLLRFNGYDALILEGKAPASTYLRIHDGRVEFCDAGGLWEAPVGETVQALRREAAQPRVGVMAIGPAAVRGSKLGCIMVDGRSFGRGGAGTVMATKNVKAVVAWGQGEIPVFDRAAVVELGRAAAAEARRSKTAHTEYGTAQYTAVLNELGCYPTRNFTTAVFAGIDGISAEHMARHYKVRNRACYRCPVGCAQICHVPDGPFRGAKGDPEYETIGSLGAQCGVSDFGAIVAAHALCDEYGLDAMSVGTIIAYAMECYERGLFTAEQLGMELRFGDGGAMVEMVRRIGEGKGFGALLGRGFRELAARFPETVPYMMHVKWMPLAAYEPRGFHGMGLSYGTSSRGACHNVGGWTIRDELLLKTHDRFALKGKGRLVKAIQDTRAYIDSLGICTVVRSSLGFTDKPSGKVLEYVTGLDLTPELMTCGERVYNLERLILVREGVRRKDDYLPARIMQEALPEGPAAGKVLSPELYEIMLSEYYEERGWDAEGVPTPARLEELGLSSLLGDGS